MRRIARRGWLLAAGIALVVLIAARAVAPIAVQRIVNRQLDRAEGYEGRIGDVDLALWRGAYQIEDMDILKSGGSAPVPFLSSPLVDLSIEWRALFDGSVVGEMWLEKPELNFVVGSRDDHQTGTEADWREVAKGLLPIKINRVTAHDGSIHFRNFRADPPVDVYLRDVDLVATNLTNSKDLSDELVAHVEFTGTPMHAGHVQARVSIDPYADLPTFDLDCRIDGVALTHFNNLFRAYAGVDVQSGSLQLVGELEAEKGRFNGYVKPFFENVDVLDLPELEKQGPLRSLWEAFVEGTSELFEDHREDRIATRIPIRGEVGSPDLGFWATLANVVRNAFVESFVPALEHSIGEESAGEG